MSLDSTGRLVAAVREGDSQALVFLFNRQFSWLKRWACGRLPHSARDGVDTSDLVQDTLIAAFSHLASFTPRHAGSFRAYLRRSVRNRVCDAIRRSNRRQPAGDVELDRLASPDCSPLDGLLDQEAAARYGRALSLLSPGDQMAVVSRYEMQYSYEQIAQVLGRRSPEAARKAVTRALARLAREMAGVDAQRV